jgi:hypothetical protein
MMAQAILNGQLVDDAGLVCEVKFDWGTSRDYGFETPWQGGFTTGMLFNYTIYNLAEGMPYHFRAVARNRNGISYGNDMVFSTLVSMGIPVMMDDAVLAKILEAV